MKAVLVGMMPVGHPLAIAYLKAYAEAEVPGARVLLRTYDRFGDPEAIARDLAAEEADVVGFSTYIWNVRTVLAAADRLKRLRPATFVVLGGPQVAHRSSDYVEHPGVDAVVRGEGERAFAELLQGRPLESILGLTWRGGSNPARPLIPDLAEVPSPLLSGAVEPAAWPELSIEASRGCPFDCSFCDWQKNQQVRVFPDDRLVEEVRLVARRRPDAVLYFVDADFFLRRERAKRLLPRLLEAAEGSSLRFDFETNLGGWDEELARAADHPRLRLSVGVQSVNPAALKTANRYTPTFHVGRIARGMRLVQRHAPKAKVSPELIFGMPGDDLAGYRRTLDWAASRPYDRLTTTPFLVLPGSPFSRSPGRWGIEHSPDPPFRLLRSSTFSDSDMEAARLASYRVNLVAAMGWFARETLRYVGRVNRGRSRLPTLEAIEAFALRCERSGALPWLPGFKRSILSSLNFNMTDPTSPSPNEIISRLSPTEAQDASEQLAALDLLDAFVCETLPPRKAAAARRFLAACRDRLLRPGLGRLASFHRLVELLSGGAGAGRWLVICRDEDRRAFEPWWRAGRRVLVSDPLSDRVSAEADGATVLGVDELAGLPDVLAGAGFEGAIVSDVYSFVPPAKRPKLLKALAGALRPRGRLLVIDDWMGFSPFRLDAPPATAAKPEELARAGWRLLARPAPLDHWTLVAAEAS